MASVQGIKVMATRAGYYNHQRRAVGSVFVLTGKIGKDSETGKKKLVLTPDQEFTSEWMEKVDPDTEVPGESEDEDDEIPVAAAVAAAPTRRKPGPKPRVPVVDSESSPEQPHPSVPSGEQPTGDQSVI